MFLSFEPAIVSSRCPLLPDEAACDFLPPVCMRVPRDSAWVAMQLNIADFATSDGQIDPVALEAALVACVDDGDKQHDQTQWLLPQIEYDSWLNRRLAIALRGWGDIVARRGSDPQSLQTLRDMEELADWVCLILHKRSKSLALRRNWCPALDEAGVLLMKNNHARRWGQRWKKALRAVAVRHRNLTTMSPWDVFPADQSADLRYVDLLPLMRFADSLSFQRDVSIEHWNANDFKVFYERVAAIVRCNGGRTLIAKQV